MRDAGASVLTVALDRVDRPRLMYPEQEHCGMDTIAVVTSTRLRIQALASAHRPLLPHRQAEILGLQAIGFDVHELVGLLGIERSSVEGSLYAARREILNDAERAPRIGTPHTRAATNAWVWCHLNCCMAASFSALRREHAEVGSRIAALEAFQPPVLRPHDALLVAAVAAGFETAEIARASDVHLATLKRTEARILREFVPPFTAATRSTLAAVAWLHATCCSSLPQEFVVAQWRAAKPQHVTRRRPASTLATLAWKARTVPVLVALAISSAFETVLGVRRPSQIGERPSVVRTLER